MHVNVSPPASAFWCCGDIRLDYVGEKVSIHGWTTPRSLEPVFWLREVGCVVMLRSCCSMVPLVRGGTGQGAGCFVGSQDDVLRDKLKKTRTVLMSPNSLHPPTLSVRRSKQGRARQTYDRLLRVDLHFVYVFRSCLPTSRSCRKENGALNFSRERGACWKPSFIYCLS